MGCRPPSAPELFPGHPFDVTGAPNRFNLDLYDSQHVWVGNGNPLGNLGIDELGRRIADG